MKILINLINLKKGFTLIELMIVVAIISVLVSMGAASYLSAQKNSRDQRRISDISQVKSSLELHFETNFDYPTSSSGQIYCNNPMGAIAWGSAWSCDGQTYMRALPKDPVGTDEFCYTYSASGPSFTLYAKLENGNHPEINESPPVNPAGCTGAGYNFSLGSEN